MDFSEAYSRYADTPLTFCHYYKYTFTFAGKAKDGTNITVSTGGCGDDIYRYEVTMLPKPLSWFEPDEVEGNAEELRFSCGRY